MSNVELDLDLFMTSVIHTVKSELAADGVIKTKSDLNPAPPMIKRMEKYLSDKYDFRNNPVLTRTEFKTKDELAYSLMDERALNSLYRELHLKGMKFAPHTLKTILTSDYVKNVDPFISYFENLPKWDKKTDYIDRLASIVNTTNHDFWKVAFKKWLVAVVACAIYPDIVNHTVLILSGKQGIGKTKFLESLLPKSLKEYFYSGTINPANKDALVQLSETLFINLDELETLNKSELGNLKALITQGRIRTRRAYGVFSENYIRRASFMGSVNDSEFLSDSTGNRRYLSFTVTGKIDGIGDICMDDVYAQAFDLLINGTEDGKFRYWFEDKEIDQINSNNDNYVRRCPEEECVLKYFEVPTQGDSITYLTPTEIIGYINKKEGMKFLDPVSSQKRLGSALQKHGFIKKSVGKQKPYMVKTVL